MCVCVCTNDAKSKGFDSVESILRSQWLKKKVVFSIDLK